MSRVGNKKLVGGRKAEETFFQGQAVGAGGWWSEGGQDGFRKGEGSTSGAGLEN
jgi:hypothetical protein